jgi:hypothetical protein
VKAENAELHRRLGLHSGNSHKPPSSDKYKKKKIVAALPKEEGKRQGGDSEVIAHRISCRVCCGQAHVGRFPWEVSASVQHGLRAKTFK